MRLVVVALALMPATGCWFRKAKTSTPAPVITSVPTEVPKAPPTIETPPRVEPAKGQISVIPPGGATPIPSPTPPPRSTRSARRPSTQKPSSSPQPAEASTVDPAVASAPEEPVLQLTPLLSAEQQTAYNTAIDGAIQRAEANLARLDPRRLRGSQRSNFERVRSFIQQAQQTRASDLAVAKSLADRADLLAQDLARNYR